MLEHNTEHLFDWPQKIVLLIEEILIRKKQVQFSIIVKKVLSR